MVPTSMHAVVKILTVSDFVVTQPGAVHKIYMSAVVYRGAPGIVTWIARLRVSEFARDVHFIAAFAG